MLKKDIDRDTDFSLLLRQDDRGFPRESGIPRWGCVMRDLEAACEIYTKSYLTVDYILFLWGYYMSTTTMVKNPWRGQDSLAGSFWHNARNVPLIVPADVDSDGRVQFWIADMAKLATKILGWLGYGEKWVQWQPLDSPRCDFSLLHGTTYASRRRGWGGHYVLGDEKGEQVWDPCPSIQGFELDGKRTNFRIL